MKKGIFLMLALMVLSVASMYAQVRIGGTDNPSPSAILDLNVDDTDAGNTKGLALPRVTLTSTTGNGGIANAIKGLLVYNIEGAVPAGTYYFDGSNWNRLSSAAQVQADWNQGTTSAADYIKNKPTLGSLAAKSTVTSADITDGTIATIDLADGAVTSLKLGINGAEGNVMYFDGSTWLAKGANIAFVKHYQITFRWEPNMDIAFADYPDGCNYKNTFGRALLGLRSVSDTLSPLKWMNEYMMEIHSTGLRLLRYFGEDPMLPEITNTITCVIGLDE
jgi:hypothetical protein